jgi:hypothetical protein
VKQGRSAYQLSPNLSIFHLFGIIGGVVGVGNTITEAVVLRTDQPIDKNCGSVGLRTGGFNLKVIVYGWRLSRAY